MENSNSNIGIIKVVKIMINKIIVIIVAKYIVLLESAFEKFFTYKNNDINIGIYPINQNISAIDGKGISTSRISVNIAQVVSPRNQSPKPIEKHNQIIEKYPLDFVQYLLKAKIEKRKAIPEIISGNKFGNICIKL